MTVLWAVGRFVNKSIDTLEKGVRFNIITKVVIIVTVFILGAFVIGVLVDIAQWKNILVRILIPFALGIIATEMTDKFLK